MRKQAFIPLSGCVVYICLLLAAGSAVTLVGCSKSKDPMLLLSAQEALDIGKQLLEDKKYFRATKHLTHAFEVEPNSRSGREALLLSADALYLQGGTDNLIKCEAKYRDFLNRFPTSDQSDYAQYKVAQCLAARGERPDRDQKITRDALAAFEELLRLYPTSEHLADARQQIHELTDRLAEHELVVAEFYNNYGKLGICDAAISRLEGLKTGYPEFKRMDAALYHLGVAYSRCFKGVEGAAAFEDLKRRYPESEFIARSEAFTKDWVKEAEKIRQQNAAYEARLAKSRAASTAKGEAAPGVEAAPTPSTDAVAPETAEDGPDKGGGGGGGPR